MLARGMGSDREEGQQGSYTYKGAACFVEEAAINLSIHVYPAVSEQSSIRPTSHLAPVLIFFSSCFEATVSSTLLSHTIKLTLYVVCSH